MPCHFDGLRQFAGEGRITGSRRITAADPIGAVRKQPEAATRTRQAAEQGDPVAAEVPETLPYAKDAKKVHVVSIGEGKGETLPYAKDAEAGDADAQLGLGGVYFRGYYVPKDYAEAMKWYRKAAEQGHAGAQASLGWMYLRCKDVPQDEAEALKWYRKAAEQGHSGAQDKLGMMYTGQGLPQDYVAAYAWYSVAAANGRNYSAGNARKYRDSIKRNRLTPAELEKGEAMAREISERIEKRKAAKARALRDSDALAKKAQAPSKKTQDLLSDLERVNVMYLTSTNFRFISRTCQ